jgi:hypothetical protein
MVGLIIYYFQFTLKTKSLKPAHAMAAAVALTEMITIMCSGGGNSMENTELQSGTG